MKLRPLLLALGLALATGAAQASLVDSFAFGFSPRTGDAWVDTQLGDMNVYARGNTDGFVDDVVVSFGAPRYLVREYVVDRHWAPGDVYYACALAYQLRRPCDYVLHEYEHNHGQGWGVIAKRLGIKPGSAAFHALKGDVGKSSNKFKAHGKPAGAPGKGDKGDKHGGDHGPGNSSQEHGHDGDHGPGNSGKDHGNGHGNGKKGGR